MKKSKPTRFYVYVSKIKYKRPTINISIHKEIIASKKSVKYIWDAESSNRTNRHFGKNELGPDSYVSDNSLSFGPY